MRKCPHGYFVINAEMGGGIFFPSSYLLESIFEEPIVAGLDLKQVDTYRQVVSILPYPLSLFTNLHDISATWFILPLLQRVIELPWKPSLLNFHHLRKKKKKVSGDCCSFSCCLPCARQLEIKCLHYRCNISHLKRKKAFVSRPDHIYCDIEMFPLKELLNRGVISLEMPLLHYTGCCQLLKSVPIWILGTLKIIWRLKLYTCQWYCYVL